MKINKDVDRKFYLAKFKDFFECKLKKSGLENDVESVVFEEVKVIKEEFYENGFLKMKIERGIDKFGETIYQTEYSEEDNRKLYEMEFLNGKLCRQIDYR